MASKESAVADEPIDVLIALHSNFDLLDFAGALEVFSLSQHDVQDETTKAFEITIAADEDKVLSRQGVIVQAQITYKEAHKRLDEFDIVVVVGGGTEAVLKAKAEPLKIITAYSELQKKDSSRERTLFSVCSGAVFLAEQGILAGLSATTHPDSMTQFENLCSHSAVRDGEERTDVVEDARYVVNNLRFDLGDEEENPYIRRKSDAGVRPSTGRKGSMSFKGSNRRESIARRASMRLGGLRVITSGGISAGVDAALYIVSVMVSEDSANEVARKLQWTWTKGLIVDGLDV